VVKKIPSAPPSISGALARKPIRVFVHLARGFGAAQWQAKWDRGEIIASMSACPMAISGRRRTVALSNIRKIAEKAHSAQRSVSGFGCCW
jgi:hypothetical protein